MGDSFLLMCGGLYDPLIGIVDAQRSGSDVLSMWNSLNRGGKTLPYTIKQNVLRYYMNEWWYNDPDAFVIRRNEKEYNGLKLSLGLLTDEEVKVSAVSQLLGGGLFSMTEPLDKIDDERLNNLYHISYLFLKLNLIQYTALDKNEKGLEVFLEHAKYETSAKGILCDFLSNSVPDEKYDIVCSFGLIEHFSPKDREKILRLHFQLTNPKRYTLISFPTNIFPYHFFRKTARFSL